MASPRYWRVKGVKMVSWLSVFSTAFLLRILQFWSGSRLGGVGGQSRQCNVRRANLLSVDSIDL